MSGIQHIHPHAIPQAGYNPIALAATLACEEPSVSGVLHAGSAVRTTRSPHTASNGSDSAPLSLKRVPRLSETRPVSSTVKPAGRPVPLSVGGA